MKLLNTVLETTGGHQQMLVAFSHFDKMQTNYRCGSQFLNSGVWGSGSFKTFVKTRV